MVWKSRFLQEQRGRTGSFLKALHLRTSEKHRTSLKYNERHCLKAEHLLWLSTSSPRGTTSFLLLTKQLLSPFNSFIFSLLSYLILSLSLCKVLGRAAVSNNNYIRENLESTVLKRVSALDKWMNVGSEGMKFYQGKHPAGTVTASLMGWGHLPSDGSNLSLELGCTHQYMPGISTVWDPDAQLCSAISTYMSLPTNNLGEWLKYSFAILSLLLD